LYGRKYDVYNFCFVHVGIVPRDLLNVILSRPLSRPLSAIPGFETYVQIIQDGIFLKLPESNSEKDHYMYGLKNNTPGGIILDGGHINDVVFYHCRHFDEGIVKLLLFQTRKT